MVSRSPAANGRSGPGIPPLFGAVARPFQDFFQLEAASGILLLLASGVSLAWANALPAAYEATFALPLHVGAGGGQLTFTVRDVVNDGLMTIFFFVVGMEIKRELAFGELRTLGRALLPGIAALGGILVPAGIYAAFNAGGAGLHGWAIPMATDIAFCIGVMALLRTRVPQGLVVFLTALAIFDDIAGVLVIALFYGHGIEVYWLAAAALVAGLIFTAARLHVTHGAFYLIGGVLLWQCVHACGIHATISGVILGMLIPGRLRFEPRQVLRELNEHGVRLLQKAEDEGLDAVEVLMIEDRLEELTSPLARFIHGMHGLMAFGIMPIFALANAGVPLRNMSAADLTAPVTAGAALGLLLGKASGIFVLTLAAVRAGVAPMPGGASRAKLLGTAVVAGIGFTVAIFIAGLAFARDGRLLSEAKLGILLGSLAAGLIGAAILLATPRLSKTA